MTVLSLQWLLARPRHPVAVIRSRRRSIVTRFLGPARRPVPPKRRAYPDLFFADPVAVEDDSRRMRHGTLPAVQQLSGPVGKHHPVPEPTAWMGQAAMSLGLHGCGIHAV